MADYSSEIQTARDMIAEAGALFTFRKRTATTAVVDKPWRVMTETTSDLTANAVKFMEGGKWTLYVEADSLGDERLYDDMQVIDPLGNVWGIREDTLNPLDPAGDGQIIMYTAELTEWPT